MKNIFWDGIERGSLKIMPKGNKKSHHHTTHIIATSTYIQKWHCKYEYWCISRDIVGITEASSGDANIEVFINVCNGSINIRYENCISLQY